MNFSIKSVLFVFFFCSLIFVLSEHTFALSINPDMSFGLNGLQPIKSINNGQVSIYDVAESENNYYVCVQENNSKRNIVIKIDNSGNTVESFSANSITSLESVFISINSTNSLCNAIVVLPNKKVLLMLYSYNFQSGDFTLSNPNQYLVRLLPSGELDSTFGDNGVSKFPNTSFTSLDRTSYLSPNSSLLLQENGKILYGGLTRDNKIILQRFLENGQPDFEFKRNGFTELQSTLNIQTTLKFITYKNSTYILATSLSNNYKIIKVNDQGDLDLTFNDVGYYEILPPTGTMTNQNLSYSDFFVDNLGNCIVVGTYNSTSFYSSRAIVTKILPSGTLDNSFGEYGNLIFPESPGTVSKVYQGQVINGANGITGIALENNKYIIVVQETAYPQNKLYNDTILTLWGINSNGTVDLSFNGSGSTTFFSYDNTLPYDTNKWLTIEKLLMGKNGNLDIFGYASFGTRQTSAIIRFNTDYIKELADWKKNHEETALKDNNQINDSNASETAKRNNNFEITITVICTIVFFFAFLIVINKRHNTSSNMRSSKIK